MESITTNNQAFSRKLMPVNETETRKEVRFATFTTSFVKKVSSNYRTEYLLTMNQEEEARKSGRTAQPKIWEILGIIAFGIVLIRMALVLF